MVFMLELFVGVIEPDAFFFSQVVSFVEPLKVQILVHRLKGQNLQLLGFLGLKTG